MKKVFFLIAWGAFFSLARASDVPWSQEFDLENVSRSSAEQWAQELLAEISNPQKTLEERLQSVERLAHLILLEGPASFLKLRKEFLQLENKVKKEGQDIPGGEVLLLKVKMLNILTYPFAEGENLCARLDMQISEGRLERPQIEELLRPYTEALLMVQRMRAAKLLPLEQIKLFVFTHVARFYQRNHLSPTAKYFTLLYTDPENLYAQSRHQPQELKLLLEKDLSRSLRSRIGRRP